MQGQMPAAAAVSVILSLMLLVMMVTMWVIWLNLMWLVSSWPLMNTPPSWFTRLWPATFDIVLQTILIDWVRTK